MDTAQKAQSNHRIVPVQLRIHFFIMRAHANEHNLDEALLEALQEFIKEPCREKRRAVGGNGYSSPARIFSSQPTASLFFCFVSQSNGSLMTIRPMAQTL